MIAEVRGTFVPVLAKRLRTLANTQVTGVVLRTITTVVARARVKGRGTDSCRRITDIIRTFIVIVTGHRLSERTNASQASFGSVTSDAIAAGCTIDKGIDHTAIYFITIMRGAFFIITTLQRLTGAGTEVTTIIPGTRISITTGKTTLLCLIGTGSRFRIAVIDRAIIAVVTIGGGARLTRSRFTDLLSITEIPIIATHAIHECRNITPSQRVTGVLGADVPIVTIHDIELALTANALTVLGTSRAIITGPIEEEILTNARRSVAAVLGALFSIFTIRVAITAHATRNHERATRSCLRVTTIGGTRISVITIHGLGHTPVELPISIIAITKVCGAGVAIITITSLATAYTQTTGIVLGAGIAVIATCGVVGDHTFSGLCIALIIGALVVIVTATRNALTGTGFDIALIVVRTKIPVIALIVVRIVHAGPGLRIAPIGRTFVAVITRSPHATTSAIFAEIGFRTEIAIITSQRVREETAGARLWITKVVGTLIAVVAKNRCTLTFAFEAESIRYAELPVITFVVVVGVDTLSFHTGFACTGVRVIADILRNLGADSAWRILPRTPTRVCAGIV